MRPPNHNNYRCSSGCRVGGRLEEIKLLINKKSIYFGFCCIPFRVMDFFFERKKYYKLKFIFFQNTEIFFISFPFSISMKKKKSIFMKKKSILIKKKKCQNQKNCLSILNS